MTEQNHVDKFNEQIHAKKLAMDHLTTHPEDLSLKFLVKHELPIFVKNHAQGNTVILIDVKSPSGKSTSIRIENTDIPQELTARFDAKTIGESFHLQQSIDNGTVLLCDPTKAIEELKDPRKARKAATLKASKFSKESDALPSETLKSVPAFETVNLTPGAPEQTIAASQVKDFLRGLVLQYQEKTLDAEAFVDRVTDNSRSFGKHDWTYLKNEVPDHSEIQALCAQQLSVN
jgi:hypothetical protein